MVALTLAIPQSCFADEFRIPYGVKTRQFVDEMKQYGYDFGGGDDSDGHVEDKGNKFIVFTNRGATEYTMDKIVETAKRCKR